MIDKNNFLPDTTFKTEQPWDEVIECLDERLESKKFKYYKKCQKCGLNSDDLVWIDFCSPKETWDNLCGRQGPLSICPECNIQVEFIIDSMS